jgi:ribulose-phosphate 3-epimerase
MPALYPSLLAANTSQLNQLLDQLTPYCHGFHLDIIDQSFVPNATIDSESINAIAHKARKPVWVHLMVKDPKSVIQSLSLQHGSIVSFHAGCGDKILDTINFINEKKYLPSIALSPKTPVSEVFPFLGTVHQVLIMSVDPGYSGQQFMPEMLSKLDPLISYRQMHKLNFRIGMDGGITTHNIKEIIARGVDDIAIGSAIFNNPDPVEFLKKLSVYIHATV